MVRFRVLWVDSVDVVLQLSLEPQIGRPDPSDFLPLHEDERMYVSDSKSGGGSMNITCRKVESPS